MDPNNTHNANMNLPPLQLPEVDQTIADAQAIDLKVSPSRYNEQAGQPGSEQAMSERRNMEMAATGGLAPITSAGRPAGIGVTVPIGSGADPAQTVAPVVTPITGNLEAADSDLIEKAWVKTAKAIIERTREDPYKQNKEITKVKAEYVKKRYNRDIKINED